GVPTLTWPREIPIDGRPADVAAVVAANAAWTAPTPVAKLFINGDPGAPLTGPIHDLCRWWPHQREVTVPGLHFVPEDAPHRRRRPRRLDRPTPPLTHRSRTRTSGKRSAIPVTATSRGWIDEPWFLSV